MENTIRLLNQLKLFDEVEALKLLKIKNVSINRESETFTFDFQLPTIAPIKEYQLLVDHFERYFPYRAVFNLEIVDHTNQNQYLEAYKAYMIDQLSNDYPMLNTLDKIPFEIDNDQLVIEVVNDAHFAFFQSYKTLIEESLNHYGFNCQVILEIKADDQYNAVVESLENEPVITITKKEPNVSQPPTATKQPYRRGMNNATQYLISDIQYDARNVLIEAFIFKTDMIETRNGKIIQTLYLTDFKDSIVAKRFLDKSQKEELDEFKKGNFWAKVYGEIRYDNFAQEQAMMIQSIEKIEPLIKPRVDHANEKRVELHIHTKMSVMDGVNTIDDYIKRAVDWGYEAIAVTDHLNVQAFPDAQNAAIRYGLKKIIYGVEVNIIDPQLKIVDHVQDLPINQLSYISFDFETTGLSAQYDEIIEFGAVKVEHGLITDRLQLFIKPKDKLSHFTTQLTGITDEMLENAPTIDQAVWMIKDFIQDHILVAHNASFDIGFLNQIFTDHGIDKVSNTIVDTLHLSYVLHKDLRYHRLGSVCRHYRIPYDENIAHRADYDAEVLNQAFQFMIVDMIEKGIESINQLNALQGNDSYKKVFAHHAMLLAKNEVGLKNMFKLVSISNIEYFHGSPKLPREVINQYREGLLIGACCPNSEVFEVAMNKTDDDLRKIIRYYDYVEIQPLSNYSYMIDTGRVKDEQRLIKVIKNIVRIATEEKITVIASGDVHYLDPKDKIYRDVYIAAPGLGGAIHPLYDRRGRIKNNPDQHFRTTDEMLECMRFLGEETAYQLVIKNTHLIADQIEQVYPLKKDLYTPKIEGADEKLTEMCYERAHKIYGNPLPIYVKERLEKELNSIIKHGFGVIYYISHQLVKKSLNDGYLVGSRGSVGSSFVATMSEITEVNPLKPHYVCPSCQYNEFFFNNEIASGYDLPDKNCPHCGHQMIGDGQDIPFETFLGFEGDKVPDIDLNFSGDYQSRAHDYTKVLFGEDKVFRAGTISTVAEKTAYGYAKGYAEYKGIDETIRSAELTRLAHGCEGVKRTTGQHPGGIIVIPEDMEVYDFTPIQFPADDVNSDWKTTHFDFHAIHDNVLKLDILGHVDPTAIRMLQDLTGIDPKTIPTNDQAVMSLFNSTKALNIEIPQISKSGALGIPEFGTSIARATLDETQPSTFNELVILSGLSHGTGVWAGNAQDLIRSSQCTLKEVIGCRDDIMVYLIAKGLNPKTAFDIMESVRKGKGVKEEWVQMMKDHQVPSWYIDSCMKIQYMFPKAHAVAYVLMAVRVAWFKVYYPREYYATYFSTRCSTYEVETLIGGKEAVLNRLENIQDRLRNRLEVLPKEKELIPVFEIALEMFERGYYFKNMNLLESDAINFILSSSDEHAILPPFSSLEGLGDNVGRSIVEARSERPFISKEDLMDRTLLNNTSLKKMDAMGVTSHLQEENQLSLF